MSRSNDARSNTAVAATTGGRADPFARVGPVGCSEHAHPRPFVAGEAHLHGRRVDIATDEVDEAALGSHPEHRRGVTEERVEVDEHDVVGRALGEGDGEVRGDGGLARPTLRCQHHGDPSAHTAGAVDMGGDPAR